MVDQCRLNHKNKAVFKRYRPKSIHFSQIRLDTGSTMKHNQYHSLNIIAVPFHLMLQQYIRPTFAAS